jgi:hypothetical protein
MKFFTITKLRVGPDSQINSVSRLRQVALEKQEICSTSQVSLSQFLNSLYSRINVSLCIIFFAHEGLGVRPTSPSSQAVPA